MATIDFLQFATAPGANVLDQASYLASAIRQNGNQPGLAKSDFANKTFRQANFIAAMIANYISVQNGNIDVLDDANMVTMLANFTSAVSLGASVRPVRVVTSSALLNVALSDYRLALNRTAGLAAMDIQLPAAQVGQSFKVVDVRGNLAAFPARILPDAGTIAQAPNFTMNEDKQSAEFCKVAAGLWSLET